MAFKNPKFLIVAGHRNLDGGGSSHEKERTPALARTHRDALKAAGFEVHYLQEEDGDGDPNFTNGDLDVVGNLARDIMAAKQGNWVMIDCHYAGDGGPKGVFSIYPRSNGLTTAIGGDQSPDLQDNNPLDEKFGRLAAHHIAQTTGLQVRTTGGVDNGLMPENHTGVGLEGFRLAMFAHTVSLQDRAIRLVIEHGDSDFDADIIGHNDFTEQAAKGLAAAAVEMFKPVKKPCKLVKFAADKTFHTQVGAIGRKQPKKSAQITINHFTTGQAVVCDGIAHCDEAFNDDRWVHIAGANGAWIHRLGINEDPGT
ncbi:MAG TPA: hypothetical protein VKB09_04560 [Thermomicrobiales bacterium]|nr:hypothetical protein [Thermomicrobiales bacterium]